MMNLISSLSSPVAVALGHTLVYSLWQAFIVFICLRLVLKLLPNASSRIKYAVSGFAYLGIAAWFIVTLILQLSVAEKALVYQETMTNIGFQQISFDSHETVFSVFSFSYLNNYLPWIVAFYFIGMGWFTVRLIYNYFQTNVLKTKGLTHLDEAWLEKIKQLAMKLNVQKRVCAFFSNHIDTPVMIGFFKPVILLPLATINHLSTQQFEAILLHELAHIRRNDYLMNLLQSIVDTILFFNPFTWWITKNIREEREKCCDEMVLQLSDPYHYARALLALEEPLRNHALVMTAVAKRPQLLHRIKNIMEMKNNRINLRQKLVALLVVISASFSVAWLSPKENEIDAQKKQDLKKGVVVADAGGSAPFNTIFPFRLLRDSNPKVVPPLPPEAPVAPAEPKASEVPALPPVPPTPPVVNVPLPPLPPIAPLAPMNNDTLPPLTNYFDSKEWKQQQEAIKKSTAEMQKYFQSDAWKKQQQAIKKNSLAMQKYFNSPEWKKQQKEIQKSAAKMQQYFKSQAWKEQQAMIQKNSASIQKYFNSPEWKKQQQEIQKSASKVQGYFNSPEWKKQQEEIQKSASKVQEYFNSPEWKKQEELIQKSTDSMTHYFKSDAWKKQQENMQKSFAQNKKQRDESKNQLQELKATVQKQQVELQKQQEVQNKKQRDESKKQLEELNAAVQKQKAELEKKQEEMKKSIQDQKDSQMEELKKK